MEDDGYIIVNGRKVRRTIKPPPIVPVEDRINEKIKEELFHAFGHIVYPYIRAKRQVNTLQREIENGIEKRYLLESTKERINKQESELMQLALKKLVCYIPDGDEAWMEHKARIKKVASKIVRNVGINYVYKMIIHFDAKLVDLGNEMYMLEGYEIIVCANTPAHSVIGAMPNMGCGISCYNIHVKQDMQNMTILQRSDFLSSCTKELSHDLNRFVDLSGYSPKLLNSFLNQTEKFVNSSQPNEKNVIFSLPTLGPESCGFSLQENLSDIKSQNTVLGVVISYDAYFARLFKIYVSDKTKTINDVASSSCYKNTQDESAVARALILTALCEKTGNVPKLVRRKYKNNYVYVIEPDVVSATNSIDVYTPKEGEPTEWKRKKLFSVFIKCQNTRKVFGGMPFLNGPMNGMNIVSAINQDTKRNRNPNAWENREFGNSFPCGAISRFDMNEENHVAVYVPDKDDKKFLDIVSYRCPPYMHKIAKANFISPEDYDDFSQKIRMIVTNLVQLSHSRTKTWYTAGIYMTGILQSRLSVQQLYVYHPQTTKTIKVSVYNRPIIKKLFQKISESFYNASVNVESEEPMIIRLADLVQRPGSEDIIEVPRDIFVWIFDLGKSASVFLHSGNMNMYP